MRREVDPNLPPRDVVIKAFPGNEEKIGVAEQHIRRVRLGEVPSGTRNPLADEDAVLYNALRSPDFVLNNVSLSGLQLLLQQVIHDQEVQNAAAKQSVETENAPREHLSVEDQGVRARQPYDRLKFPAPNPRIRRRVKKVKSKHEPKPLVHGGDPERNERGFGHVPVHRYVTSDTPIITSEHDLMNYSVDTSLVYLTKKVIDNPDFMKRILERFPHLAIVQVADLIKIKKDIRQLLQDKGINIRRQWVRQRRKRHEVPIISGREGIDKYPANASIIHIGNQDVLRRDVIEEILSYFKNLKVLELYPSANVSDEWVKFVEAHGIEIRKQRTRQNSTYDIVPVSQEYLNDKERYLAAFLNPDTQEMMQFMQRQDFLEVTIANRYFGEERLSIRQIARGLGVTNNLVQRKLSILLVVLGGKTNSENIRQSAENLKKRIAYLQRIEMDAIQRKRYRQSFGVTIGDKELLPPLDLSISKWEMWHRIASISDDKLEELRQHSQQLYEILIKYWQPRNQDKTKGAVELSKEYGVSYQIIQQRLKKALRNLGVSEEK